MGELRDRMEGDLLLRGLAEVTRAEYLRCARQLAAHYRRSPAELGAEDIRAYLFHLARTLNYSPANSSRSGKALAGNRYDFIRRRRGGSAFPKREELASHLLDGADFKGRERCEKIGDQREKIREAVRLRTEHYDSQGPVLDALLLWEALVDRDQRVKVAAHGVQQVAVVEVAPIDLGGGSNLMTGEVPAKAFRDTGVEENSHFNDRSRLSGHCLLKECGLRESQHGDGVFARDAGEVVEEGLQGVARFEIFDQRLHRDSGAGEHGGSAQAIGRRCDQGLANAHARLLLFLV